MFVVQQLHPFCVRLTSRRTVQHIYTTQATPKSPLRARHACPRPKPDEHNTVHACPVQKLSKTAGPGP
jgi:hypothetical protein